MDTEIKEVGLQIRIIRKAKRLTQEAVAERVGIDPKSLGRIEKGTYLPSLETLGKLAKALDTPVSAFFPLSEDYRFDKPISLSSVRHHLVDFIYSADEAILMRWFKDSQ